MVLSLSYLRRRSQAGFKTRSAHLTRFLSIARKLQGAHSAPKHMRGRLEAGAKVPLRYMLAQKT